MSPIGRSMCRPARSKSRASFRIPTTFCAPVCMRRSVRPPMSSQARCWFRKRAVLETQGQYQVAVVDADNRVSLRTVKTGKQVGDLRIIEDGVEARRTRCHRGSAEGLRRDGSAAAAGARRADSAAAPAAAQSSVPSAPAAASASPARQAQRDVEVLHQPANRGDGHRDFLRDRRRRDGLPAAGRAVPRDRAARRSRPPRFTPAPTRSPLSSRSPLRSRSRSTARRT